MRTGLLAPILSHCTAVAIPVYTKLSCSGNRPNWELSQVSVVRLVMPIKPSLLLVLLVLPIRRGKRRGKSCCCSPGGHNYP